MLQYTDFISQNIAPKSAKCIDVYDSNGVLRGTMPLGNLRFPDIGNKKYSFGAISDIHLQNDTAQDDFQRALTYLNETEDVAFTCIAGDLTDAGTASQLATYKQYVDTYSPNTPVYAITGNHESRNANIITDFQTYTGRSIYYSFEHNGDVFIMVGSQPDSSSDGWVDAGGLFSTEELQWLYETLEANRNKRCFVFQHVRPQDGCGNTFGIYSLDIWGGTEQTVFESLMHHYKNAHHFHGHSHLKFYLQYGSDIANIDHLFGGWSIHIPSLAVPRDGDPSGASSRKEIYADSEGYVVDVYDNCIHLRGRDFVKGEFLPIASYLLDTTIQEIAERSYTDPTGTIVTEIKKTFTIASNFTNITSNNSATSIEEGQPYTATLTPAGASITSVVVTMGGVNVTSSVYSNGVISISSVTGNIVITAVGPEAIKYTNVLPLAIGSDGKPYNNGQGWKANTRLNSSGVESTSSASGIEVTGFIPVKNLDRVYMRNVTMNRGSRAGQTYWWLYDASFNKLTGRYRLFSQYADVDFNVHINRGTLAVDENNNITMFQIEHNVFYTGSTLADMSNVAYLRISCEEISNNSIITVNEPID